jgi:diadenosine tetraphosphatase ApaH/serine/threonine PP2A family protein phosphatase
MSQGRTLVVGDIHGCYDELLELMEKARPGSNDRIIAVGDLVTKGPKSAAVLDLFESDNRFSSVMGNQDLALLRCWRGEDVELTPAQSSALSELAAEAGRFRNYLESLPFMIDLGEHVIVHAGVRPGVALASQSKDDLAELRTLGADRTSRDGTPWYDAYDGAPVVLFGHWPALEVRRARRAIGLDTGCVYGHRLTAYVIETGELLSVGARRAYDHPKRPLQ